MHKIYGFHPELAVDYQMDVVMKSLKQQAFEKAAKSCISAQSCTLQQRLSDKGPLLVLSTAQQYDDLKPKWEALQTNQTRRNPNDHPLRRHP